LNISRKFPLPEITICVTLLNMQTQTARPNPASRQDSSSNLNPLALDTEICRTQAQLQAERARRLAEKRWAVSEQLMAAAQQMLLRLQESPPAEPSPNQIVQLLKLAFKLGESAVEENLQPQSPEVELSAIPEAMPQTVEEVYSAPPEELSREVIDNNPKLLEPRKATGDGSTTCSVPNSAPSLMPAEPQPPLPADAIFPPIRLEAVVPTTHPPTSRAAPPADGPAEPNPGLKSFRPRSRAIHAAAFCAGVGMGTKRQT
jgi:hypothetical protein